MNFASSLRCRRYSRRGFTLMEMLIVLMIIALLLGIAMTTFTGASDHAKVVKAEADIASFKMALMEYEMENGSFPTAEQGLDALWKKPEIEPIPQHWHAQFSEELPLDPWNHPYKYLMPGKHNPNGFDVFSLGPDGLPDTDDDIGNWKQPSTAANP